MLMTVFQNIFDMFDRRRVVGREALLRGVEGQRTVPARELFQEAAAMGVVMDLDRAAREEAMRVGVPALEPGQRLFVNLAAETLERCPPAEWFKERAPLNRLVVEISEHARVASMDMGQLEALRKRGLQIALDDYGVERTNLHQLEHLHPDWLKLDLSFVRQGAWNTILQMRRFVEGFPGMRLVVEGVESEEAVSRLLDAGVRYMQGFALHRPEPLREEARHAVHG